MRLGKYEDLVHVTKFHTSVKTSPSLSSLIFSWVKRTENECVVTRYRCNGIIFFFYYYCFEYEKVAFVRVVCFIDQIIFHMKNQLDFQ